MIDEFIHVIRQQLLSMSETDLTRLLMSVDEAIAVFQAQKVALNAREISVKSMLLALRVQVAEQLARERNGSPR